MLEIKVSIRILQKLHARKYNLLYYYYEFIIHDRVNFVKLVVQIMIMYMYICFLNY